MSQWQQVGVAGAQGYTSTGAGGLGMTMRDPLDAKRAAVGSIPEAQYPDGYLGTIQSRREDRLLQSMQKKLGEKRYDRGVHVGEKRSPEVYMWPADQRPDRGLVNQQYGIKTAPTMLVSERLTMGHLPPGAVAALGSPLAEINPHRAEQLRRLAPSWR